MAGAATGAGIGQWLGSGPAGAAYGATATIMFKDVVLDFTNRLLGHREEQRIGAVIRYFWDKYQENLAAGNGPRQDGFFEDASDDRAAAKEVFEGVLLAAQREHQEKKLRFFGNLVANIAFHPEYDRAHANQLIKVAEELSYRQLCLLSIFARNDQSDISLRQQNYQGQRTGSVELIGLLGEIYDLCRRQLLNDPTEQPDGRLLVLELQTIVPSKLSVYSAGDSLYYLMELWHIDDRDLVPLIELLQ